MKPYPQPYERYSWETYLELEAQSEERWEFHNGEILSLAGATNRHNKIVLRTSSWLLGKADRKGCDVFSESVRLFKFRSDRYYYPDVMVTCHPLDRQTKNGVRSPLLIVEVVSNRSAKFDYSTKLRDYFVLPSLMHYLVVEQEECLVHHYHRLDSDEWRIAVLSDLEQQLTIPELEAVLPLAEIYRGVEFGPEVTSAEEAAQAYGDEAPPG